jgi:hypothetical protein
VYDPSVRGRLATSAFFRRIVGIAATAAGICGAATCAAPGVAHADEPSAADVASARKIGFEGMKLAEKGDCAAAIDKLARAEKLFHAPTTLGRLGECQVQVGKVVEGTESLGRVAREELATNAPAAFVAARARAKKQLALATPKLAHAKIIVRAPSDATVSVSVDSLPVNAANVGEERVLDPGPHLVEASAPGYRRASSAINLREGATEDVTLTLIIDPEAARAARSAAAAGPAPGPVPDASSSAAPGGSDTKPVASEAPNRTLAYVVLGLGVVGVGVGSVFGLSALSKKSDLSKACPNSTCHTSQQGALDSAKTSGTISTIAFAAGGAALIAGGVLFFTASSPAPSAAFVARPYVGLTSAGVSGSF